MDKRQLKKYRRTIISSVLYILVVVFATTSVTFAWFTLTNTNRANLISNVSEIEAEYEFFAYQNLLRDGSDELTLNENVCTDPNEDLCYLPILNPTVPFIIQGASAPGERFSFAIRITSVNNPIGSLKLDLGGLESIGYDIEQNKLQTAFYYQVDKVSFENGGIETEDVKDSFDIICHYGYFTYDNDEYYPLISNVPMRDAENTSTRILIFFSLYFDPFVFGQKPDGTPYENSNIFINQTFTIHHLYMTVSN